jgi:lipopolysaccharide exporter
MAPDVQGARENKTLPQLGSTAVLTPLKKLYAKVESKGAERLVRGFGAHGSAEIVNRVVRLAATVVIARQLAPEIVGEAALALTLFEIIRVFANTGVGPKVIACPEKELAATCNTAHRLFWMWSGVLVLVQLAAAGLLAGMFDRPVAAAMLAMLSLVYLFMPGGLVQAHLAMREGLNGRLARIGATQAIADHILTAGLLLAWPSPWSIALPKLLTAPIWLIMMRKARPWRYAPYAGRSPMREMFGFSAGILASEVLTALRTQGDNLIIAATMGTSVLGVYYFAYNAGIGISSSLVRAFGIVAFPMLCAAHSGEERLAALRHVWVIGAAVFIPIVALQSFGAPYYVPLVFGERWSFAAPLIATMCLAGLALLVSTITTCWLRAEGRVHSDATSSLIVCVTALGGLFIGTRLDSLQAAVVGLVIGQTIGAIFNAIRVLPFGLRRKVDRALLKEQLA